MENPQNNAYIDDLLIDGKTINGLQKDDVFEFEITLIFTKDKEYKIISQEITVIRGESKFVLPDIFKIAGGNSVVANNIDANDYNGGDALALPTKNGNGVHKLPKSNKRKYKRILNKTVSYKRPNTSSHLYKYSR